MYSSLSAYKLLVLKDYVIFHVPGPFRLRPLQRTLNLTWTASLVVVASEDRRGGDGSVPASFSTRTDRQLA